MLALVMGMLVQLHAQEPSYRKLSTYTQDSANIMNLLYRAASLQNSLPDSCVIISEAALQQSMRIDYNFGIAKALMLAGVGYRNMGRYEQSLVIFRKAMPYLERLQHERDFQKAVLYTVMYGAYFPLGHYDSGAIMCYRVIDIYHRPENRSLNSVNNTPLIDAYQFLGNSWLRLKYGQQAMEYLNKAEQLSRKNKIRHGLINILNSKGVVYLEMKQYDTALSIFTEGMQLAIKAQDVEYMRLLNMNLASVYLHQGQQQKAIAMLTELLAQSDTAGIFNETAIDIANILAKAYYDVGSYDKALNVLLAQKQKADQYGIRENSFTTNYMLALIYAAQNNTARAYQYLLKGVEVFDTLSNTDKVQALNILDFKLQTAEKDNEISRKQLLIASQKNEIKQSNLLIVVLAASGVLLVVLVVVVYRSNNNKRRLQEEKINRLNKEQEIIQLKAIMKGEEKERGRIARELHDGFVSQLTAVKMNFSVMPNKYSVLTSATDYQQNLAYLEETIRELRKTAHNMMPEILMNGGLAEAVQVYCERIGQMHRPDVDFQLYGFVPRLDAEFELALYRMIQELLQNVIKHANATQALVQINCADEVLSVTIEDNGIGLPQDGIGDKDSAGLKTLEARVQAYNGTIEINSDKDIGTTIYLEFDLRRINETSQHAAH